MSFYASYADPRAYWTERGKTYASEEADVALGEFAASQGRYLLGVLLRHGVCNPAARVLEVGCGYGRLLRALGAEAPRLRLTGADFSATQLAGARAAGCSVVEADASALPFRDRAFDVVFTQGCLMHVPHDNIQSVRHELARVAGMLIHTEASKWEHPDFIFVHDHAAAYHALGLDLMVYADYPHVLEGQAMTCEVYARRQ